MHSCRFTELAGKVRYVRSFYLFQHDGVLQSHDGSGFSNSSFVLLCGGVISHEQTMSQLLCPSCGRSSATFEGFMDLSLEIHEYTDSLEEMFEAFTCPERLDKHNKLRCEGCSELVRAHKQLTIYEASNILCIQLKRFRVGVFGKVNKFVKFPEKLNLKV